MTQSYTNRLTATFFGGGHGPWEIDKMATLRGQGLPDAARLEIVQAADTSRQASWALAGVTSHARYVERAEKGPLDSVSPGLGRPEAVRAVLIPIRKSAAWWSLPQDERRAIFETRSHHIAASMPYLPRIARRLYHARDLGQDFDFLTWFEFAPEHEAAFDELLGTLRSREEWAFVEREIEVRMRR